MQQMQQTVKQNSRKTLRKTVTKQTINYESKKTVRKTLA